MNDGSDDDDDDGSDGAEVKGKGLKSKVSLNRFF